MLATTNLIIYFLVIIVVVIFINISKIISTYIAMSRLPKIKIGIARKLLLFVLQLLFILLILLLLLLRCRPGSGGPPQKMTVKPGHLFDWCSVQDMTSYAFEPKFRNAHWTRPPLNTTTMSPIRSLLVMIFYHVTRIEQLLVWQGAPDCSPGF